MTRKFLTVAIVVLVVSAGVGLGIPVFATRNLPQAQPGTWTPPSNGYAPSPAASFTPTPALAISPTSPPLATAPAASLAAGASHPASSATPSGTGVSAKVTPKLTESTDPATPTPTASHTATDTPTLVTLTPSATRTPLSLFTPSPTNTLIPTATPTPEFDYVVKSIREIPLQSAGDIAHIRGKLIDRNGNLVKGTQFRIRSDAIPNPWEAIDPPLSQADGTVEFTVTRGRYSVRVVGGRSQEAGWMLTGVPNQPQMSNWEFVFQTTQ